MTVDIFDILDNLDQQQMQSLLDQLDEEAVQQQLEGMLDEALTPHLMEIREGAQDAKGRKYWRAKYGQLNEAQQTQVFMDAVSDLVAISEEIRERPMDGLQRLKKRLRNPKTMEALLLVFNDNRVPRDWQEERKEFSTTMVRWVGMNLMPEAYTRDEAEALVEELFPDQDLEELLGPPPGEDGSRGPGDAPGSAE